MLRARYELSTSAASGASKIAVVRSLHVRERMRPEEAGAEPMRAAFRTTSSEALHQLFVTALYTSEEDGHDS